MSEVLSEKQILIIPLIATLKKFNPSIGRYVKSYLNANTHIVELDNGLIEIEDKLLQDYLDLPEKLIKNELKLASQKFVLSKVEVLPPFKKDKILLNGLRFIVLLLVLLLFIQKCTSIH